MLHFEVASIVNMLSNAAQVDPGGLPLVSCAPLGFVLERLALRHIHFWSLDVEGAELEVLRTVDLSQVLKTHSPMCPRGDCVLNPKGYSRCRMMLSRLQGSQCTCSASLLMFRLGANDCRSGIVLSQAPSPRLGCGDWETALLLPCIRSAVFR